MGPTRWFRDPVSVGWLSVVYPHTYLDGYVRPLIVKDLVQLKGKVSMREAG